MVGMPGLPADHALFARAALPAYRRDLDTPLQLLSLSENATYLVCDDDPIVLRVHRPGYHSLEAIRSELVWMGALRAQTAVSIVLGLALCRDVLQLTAMARARNSVLINSLGRALQTQLVDTW